jgi:hypothetical protein
LIGRTSHALALYFVTSILATWPLARGIARDVAWDLGDSVLNMWILSWDCEQIRHILRGDFAQIGSFFDANIFYPVPHALAYSEHLFPQAVQIFPVYLLTGNPILCYNLLFLSTFVLAGFGMYLLVRELTGSAEAAFIAGVLFAFAPYRLAQSSHLQVLSAQWMPFVFFGLVRYFRSGRIGPLAGAAAALVAQNLSSGYYLLFFAPFAVAFAIWELMVRGLWRDRRRVIALSVSGLVVAALTAPFMLPYVALHNQGVAARSLAEVSRFSADVYSYATTFAEQRVWGQILQAAPKPEGELFPGAVAVLLALIGVFFGGSAYAGPALLGTADDLVHRPGSAKRTRRSGPGPWLVWLLAFAALAHFAAAAFTLVSRRVIVDLGPFTIQMTDVDQLLLRGTVAFVLVLVASPDARVRVSAFLSRRGFFVVGLIAAAWLSLGPFPESLGRPVEIAAPYRLLFQYVPGFEGVRAPARFGMIVICMLAVLAGYGASTIARARIGRWALIAAGVFALLEGTEIPFTVNGITPLRDYNTPEARLYRPARAPAIYHELARQPSGSVLIELPLGQIDFDLRAMYYSTVHWRPIVNGYSGYAPPHYSQLIGALSELPRHPDLSLQALEATGATHLILHEAAYRDDEGTQTAAVLRQAGAVEVFRDGTDVLFFLPH